MRGTPRLIVLATVLALPAAAGAAGPGATLLLSRPTGLGALPPAGDNDALATRDAQTDDGRFVVFRSKADDLGVRDGLTHVYRRDTMTGETMLIDKTAFFGPGNGNAFDPVISGDGTAVCFTSLASNLVPGVAPFTNGFFTGHVLVAKPGAGTIVAADRADGAGGELGTKGATNCALDTTGAHAAFTSDAGNLVPGDTNSVFDTFVRDLAGLTTKRVSLSSTGAQSPGGGFGLSISGNGSRVSFTTRQPLVAGETGTEFDIYVRDTGTNTTIRASLGTGSVAPNGDSGGGALSDDGNEVAFSSSADNLVGPGQDTNLSDDVFVRFIGADETVLVSRAAGNSGAIGNSHSGDPAITGNGLAVAFTSQASNLGAGTPAAPFGRFAYVRALSSGALEAVSRASGADGAPASVEQFSEVGATASAVTFTARSAGVDPESSDDFSEVFRRQLGGDHATTMVSRPTGSGPRDSDVNNAVLRDGAISADGRLVAFTSAADGLFATPGTQQQAFVRDTLTGTTTLVSRAAGEGPAADRGVLPGTAVVSADGSTVAFVSQATNLVSGVSARNVYVRNLATGELRIASRGDGPEGGPLQGQTLTFPVRIGISADGSRVAFTTSSGLAPADQNNQPDVYVRDLAASTTTLASVTAAGGTAAVKSEDAALSGDGVHVAFVSAGSGFVPDGPTDGSDHLYVRNVAAGTTVLADRHDGTGTPDGPASGPVLSADGSRVAFRSLVQLTDEPVTIGTAHIYVRDISAGRTLLAGRSDGPSGAPAQHDFDSGPAISADGRTVSFAAFGLPGAPDAAHPQVFRRELDTDRTTLVSAADGGALAPLDSAAGASALSADGGCVAFAATSAGLATPDFATVDFGEVYLRAVAGECPRPAATPPGSPPDTTDRTAPVLSRVSLTNKRFRVGRRITAISARTKVGTAFRYTLSEDATVRIAVARRRPGRRSGRRCVAPTKRLRKRARCTRIVAAVTLRRASRKGASRVAFSGRTSRRRALRPGSYQATLRATDAAGNASAPRTVRFRVVPSSRLRSARSGR